MISVMDMLAEAPITYATIRNSVEVNESVEKASKVENGDLVFVRSSEVVNEVGWSKSYLDDEYALYSGFSIRGKKQNEYNPLFLELAINGKARQQIERKAGGSTRFNVSQGILGNVEVHMPEILEQDDLAKTFKMLNDIILLRQQELAKLQHYKQAMLQKVFPKEGEDVPEIRFKGFDKNWGKIKIGKIMNKGGSGGTPNTSMKEYYNGNIPFLGISDITKTSGSITRTDKEISEKGLLNSTSYIVPKGSVSLAMYASVGKVAKLGVDVATSQAFYNLEFKDEVTSDFVYFYLKKMEQNHEWEKMVSTGTQANLNASKVVEHSIDIPSFEEMEQIVAFLQPLDKYIQAKQAELKKLKQFKQAMLNKLFV